MSIYLVVICHWYHAQVSNARIHRLDDSIELEVCTLASSIYLNVDEDVEAEVEAACQDYLS